MHLLTFQRAVYGDAGSTSHDLDNLQQHGMLRSADTTLA